MTRVPGFMCVMLLSLAFTGPALAAPAHTTATNEAVSTDAHGGKAEAEHKSGGLPQLDVTRFPGQAFWLVLAFALTYGLMRYVAMPDVERTLGNRAAKIEGDVAEAKAMNEQVKLLTAETATQLNKARDEAQEVMRMAHEEASRKAASMLAEQQKTLHVQLNEAESRLMAVKNEALAGLELSAASVVADLVKRVAGVTADAGTLAAALKKAKGA